MIIPDNGINRHRYLTNNSIAFLINQSTSAKNKTKKIVNEITIDVSRRFSFAVGQTTRCISWKTLLINFKFPTSLHGGSYTLHNVCKTFAVLTAAFRSNWWLWRSYAHRTLCIPVQPFSYSSSHLHTRHSLSRLPRLFQPLATIHPIHEPFSWLALMQK